MNKVSDFVDFEEVDHDDVKVRLFAKIFYGDVKKWFNNSRLTIFSNYLELEDAFLARWCEKKNPLQIMDEYNNLK